LLWHDASSCAPRSAIAFNKKSIYTIELRS